MLLIVLLCCCVFVWDLLWFVFPPNLPTILNVNYPFLLLFNVLLSLLFWFVVPPHLPTKIIPAKMCRLSISEEFPYAQEDSNPLTWNYTWVEPDEIPNLSTEIGGDTLLGGGGDILLGGNVLATPRLDFFPVYMYVYIYIYIYIYICMHLYIYIYI